MSVRGSVADELQLTSAWNPGTGDFSFGVWINFQTDTDAPGDFMGFGTADNSLDVLGMFHSATGTTIIADSDTVSSWGTFDASLTTWYFIVLSRSGTTLRLRVFDDTASTTPQSDETAGPDASDFDATFDTLRIGRWFTSQAAADAEYENAKVHNGVAWTDAQCRTESQNYGIQTGGGTAWGSWELRNTDADTEGINDGEGGGRDLTNSGFTNGATSPSQLAAAGGVAMGFGQAATFVVPAKRTRSMLWT